MNRIFYTLILVSVINIIAVGQDNVYLDLSKYEHINSVVLANINGNVNVEGTKSNRFNLQGTVDSESVDKKEYKVEHLTVNDTLIIYIKTPCSSLQLQPEDGFFKASWSIYHWEDTKSCKNQMDYKVDLQLTIPNSKNLSVSTINEGDLVVNNFEGNLWAKNINGSIALKDVRYVHEARTINGDVTIHFNGSPEVEGSYYTLNGDIESFYPKNVGLDITFKSFNGDFFTDNDNLKTLPSTVENSSTGKGFKIKISEHSKMRIGNGGPLQRYETFNGDAIIRTNSKR